MNTRNYKTGAFRAHPNWGATNLGQLPYHARGKKLLEVGLWAKQLRGKEMPYATVGVRSPRAVEILVQFTEVFAP